MVNNQINAQEWLNQTIPWSQRQNINKLIILPQSIASSNERYHQILYHNNPDVRYVEIPLTGSLKLENFVNLEEFALEGQEVTELDLSGCEELRNVRANNNLLRNVIWPLRANWLEDIQLVNNNIQRSDLLVFGRFAALNSLMIGTNDREKINQGIYNRWYGSLFSLRNLFNLVDLDINATDVSQGLEHLPLNRLKIFTFGKFGRTNSGVEQLQNVLVDTSDNEDFCLGSSARADIDQWATKGTFGTESFGELVDKISSIAEWQDCTQFEARMIIN